MAVSWGLFECVCVRVCGESKCMCMCVCVECVKKGFSMPEGEKIRCLYLFMYAKCAGMEEKMKMCEP